MRGCTAKGVEVDEDGPSADAAGSGAVVKQRTKYRKSAYPI